MAGKKLCICYVIPSMLSACLIPFVTSSEVGEGGVLGYKARIPRFYSIFLATNVMKFQIQAESAT